MKYLVQLQTPIPGNRREVRNALLRTVLETEFTTAEAAIEHLAAPWRVGATTGRAIALDNRPVNAGGGVTILATRRNGEPIRKSWLIGYPQI